MARLRVQSFATSIDGYSAGPRQDLANPLGVGGRDVRLGGGVATIRQYLRAGLIDEIHLAIAPVLLGSGESLFRDIDATILGLDCVQHVPTAGATHVILKKRA